MNLTCSGVNQPWYELGIPFGDQQSSLFFISTSPKVSSYTWMELMVSLFWFITKHKEGFFVVIDLTT
jgi:hypothetical protein